MAKTANRADARFQHEGDHHSRIIAHFDFDAFYVACERELNPGTLLNVPVAVSQYNPYGNLEERSSSEVSERLVVCPGKSTDVQNSDTNGSLIAVSYEARAAGVRRNDRGHDAARKCRDLHIVQVPVKFGKADLTMYRDASQRVLDVLVSALKSYISENVSSRIKVEKASIDEIYIDLTAAAGELAESVLRERCHSPHNFDTKQGDGGHDQKSQSGESGPNHTRTWLEILSSTGVSLSTTIAGTETMSDAAMAAACLSKDDLRRGSKLQVLDSASLGGNPLDNGSLMWWGRGLGKEWTEMEIHLACGAALASYARNVVQAKFHVDAGGKKGAVFTLSAGISTNKTLAKLASGLKKPNRQTLINPLDGEAIKKLFHPLKLGRIRGLGGKFGDKVSQKLGVATVGDLARLSLSDIECAFPSSPDDETPTAKFLFFISRGVCTDEVENRTKPKSIACSKTFRGPLSIIPTDAAAVRKRVGELCSELIERVSADKKRNGRIPSLLVVSVHLSSRSGHISRSAQAPKSLDGYADTAVRQVEKMTSSSAGGKIVGMSVSASQFIEVADGSNSIMAAFGRGSQLKATTGGRVKHAKLPSRKPGTLLDSFVQKHRISEEPTDICSPRATPDSTPLVSGFNGVRPERQHYLHNMSASRSNEAGMVALNRCQDSESEKIDPDVLHQLPPELRVEIKSSMMSGNKRREVSSSSKALDQLFLVKKEASTNNRKRQYHQKKGSGNEVNSFFAARNRKENTAESKSHAYQSLTWDSLDHNVLDELPCHVKTSLLNEMTSESGQQSGKKTRIDNFFSK